MDNKPIDEKLKALVEADLLVQKNLYCRAHELKILIKRSRNTQTTEALRLQLSLIVTHQLLFTSRAISKRLEVSESTISKIKNSNPEFQKLKPFRE